VLTRYSDLVGRLRVFANTGVDPALVEAMTGTQYADVVDLLSRAAQLVVSDLGTSTAGEVAVAALDAADQLVLCTELRRDALEIALEWLSALYGQPKSYRPEPEDYVSIADGRYAELASRAIVVVAPGGGDRVALQQLLNWFAEATNAGRDGGRVVVVPHDPHIARGEQILLDQLQPATRLAYLQIAAHVVDNFALGRLGARRLPPAPGVLPQLAVQSAPPVQAQDDQPPRTATPASTWPAGAQPAGGGQEAAAAARAGLRSGTDGEVPLASRLATTAAPLRPPAAGALRVATGPFTSAPPDTPASAIDRRPGTALAAQVGDAASLALGRDLAGVLGVQHTEGEVCTGCAVRGCGWPVPPPAGAGERA